MNPSRLAPLLVLLVAPAALAANIVVQAGGSTAAPYRFGRDACNDNNSLNFTWDVDNPFTEMKVQLRKGDCSSGDTLTLQYNTIDSNSYSVAVPLQQFLFDLTSGDGGQGCNSAVSSAAPRVVYLCVTTSNGTTTLDTGSFAVNFALTDPTPPVLQEVQGGDRRLRAVWRKGNSNETIANYDVYVVPQDGGFDVDQPAISEYSSESNEVSVDLTRTGAGAALSNELEYDVAVRARDRFLNVSALSDKLAGRPVPVDDFYNLYRRNGGEAEGGGGCESTPTGAWLVVAIAAAAAFLARRKKAGGALLVLAALAAPGAQAAERETRRWLVSLKVDKYSPEIDSEPALGGKTPYATIFGTRVPTRWQLETSYQAFHPFGAVLLGGSAGFWENIGRGVYAKDVTDSDGNILNRAGDRSNDTALLRVVPLSLLATWRFDWLADRYRFVPLIPYVQAGLSAALWISYSGTKNVSVRSEDPGQGRGSGWTLGTVAAVGLAVPLDFIDTGVSDEAYLELGLQRTSLFAEYGWTTLDGFGGGKSLVLSARDFRFGLSMEF